MRNSAMFNPSDDELRSSVARGAAITGGAQVVEFGTQLASVLILSRLLAPEDFGLIAMCAPVIAFLGMLRSFGLVQATVQKTDLTHEDANFLFWINMAASVVIAVFLFAVSPLIAKFYGEPQVGPLVAAMSLTILTSSLAAQHSAILNRKMLFGYLAIASIINVTGTFAVAVIWALFSPTYWAIFVGTLSGSLLSSAYTWAVSAWRPGLPRRADGAAALLKFGGGVTGFNLTNFFARNADNMLIGRYWGSVELGLYDRAYKLLLFPLSRVANPLSRVVIPALSRMDKDPGRYRLAFLKVLNLSLMITLPGIAWATATADVFVPLVLGDTWAASGNIFAALGFAGMVQPLNNPAGWLFISQGRSNEYMIWGVVTAVLAVSAFVAGLPWAAFGVAVAYAVSEYIKTVPLWLYIGRRGPVRARDILRGPGPLVLAAHVGLGAVWLIRDHVGGGDNVMLVITLSLSYLVFCSVAALFPSGRETLREAFRLVASNSPLRRRRSRSSKGSAP